MSTHYFHVEEAKRKGIIQNPNVKKNCGRWHIISLHHHQRAFEFSNKY
jgi:hypothetical protein